MSTLNLLPVTQDNLKAVAEQFRNWPTLDSAFKTAKQSDPDVTRKAVKKHWMREARKVMRSAFGPDWSKTPAGALIKRIYFAKGVWVDRSQDNPVAPPAQPNGQRELTTATRQAAVERKAEQQSNPFAGIWDTTPTVPAQADTGPEVRVIDGVEVTFTPLGMPICPVCGKIRPKDLTKIGKCGHAITDTDDSDDLTSVQSVSVAENVPVNVVKFPMRWFSSPTEALQFARENAAPGESIEFFSG